MEIMSALVQLVDRQPVFVQASSVRHEVMLLASSLQQEDACWEQRVRCGKMFIGLN